MDRETLNALASKVAKETSGVCKDAQAVDGSWVGKVMLDLLIRAAMKEEGLAALVHMRSALTATAIKQGKDEGCRRRLNNGKNFHRTYGCFVPC